MVTLRFVWDQFSYHEDEIFGSVRHGLGGHLFRLGDSKQASRTGGATQQALGMARPERPRTASGEE